MILTLPCSSFTTDDLPVKDRFGAWREDISLIFDLEKSPIGEERPYHASIDFYHFGQSVMGHLTASSGRYVRSKRKTRKDGMDAILFQLFLEGEVQFGTERGTTYAKAGEIVVFDMAQPLDNINTRFRNITAMWPRMVIEEILPDIGRWHGHALPKDSPLVDLLRRHMISCNELAPRFNMEEGRRVENTMLSLVSAALAEGELLPDTSEKCPVAEMFLYQIKRYIRQNLGLRNLSPVQIAGNFGISRTQLYELLEPLGGIARYQRHLRLQRCLMDLRSPTQAHLRISEIAYRWGFAHLATFNRNFRDAFGFTPREARLSLMDGRGTDLRSSPDLVQRLSVETEHHRWFRTIGL